VSRQIIISPTQNLIHEVVKQLPTDSRDFSRFVIVFPGKRPAHFVRKALAERIKGSFIPPRIFSIDAFIDHLIADRLHVHRKALENLDAVALLFDIHARVEHRLGGEHFDYIDRFVGVGLKLYAELEELVMADVPERRIRDGLANVPLSRFHALPNYFAQFYALVDDRNFTTRALNYKKVADNVDSLDFASEQNVIVAGFYAYTALEQRIFTSLLRRENATIVAQQGPGLGRRLETIGIDVGAEETFVPEHTPVCHFYQSSDAHGQVFAVSQKIKTMLDAGKPVNEKTVIVLPTSDALFPVVHQTLPLLPPDQYNISLGYPLQRTPLYGFFSTLIELSAGTKNGKVPISKYTKFILHPYTKNILYGQRADISRVLFHSLETHLAEGQSKMFVSLEELEGKNEVFERISEALAASGTEVSVIELKSHLRAIHDKTIRRVLRFESIGDFASQGIEIVHYIHKQSTATRHPLFRPYAETFVALLDSLGASLLASHQLTDVTAYCTFFRNAVAAAEVPFPGTPLKGLQVIGFLETRNLSFDTVFLLNATDDVIPGARGHDVLLPQRLRETLGLETYSDRERLAEYYFNTLLAGAHEVHCFFTESGKHEKSRFIEKLLWEYQKNHHDLDLGNVVQVVRYDVQLAISEPDSVEKTPNVIEYLRKFQYTATALDTYLTCPLKFYYAHVLHLSEKEDVTEDVDEREVGSVVHAALKTFFDGVVGRALTPADLDPVRLRSVVDRLFTEEYGSELIGPAFLVKQQVMYQLGAFLREYQLPMTEAGPITIVGLEQGLSATCDGYRFTGRIDRIEQRGDKHVILDYKTGRDDRRVRINLSKLDIENPHSWRDAIGSFQLVMYMLLYSRAKQIPLESITPSYLFVGRNEVSREIETDVGGGKTTAEEVYRQVQPVMLRVIEEILDVKRAFEPTDQLNKACPSCPYSTMCGTSWVSGQRP
jgi:ATP-dependent helicase/nuclease subunit B